MDSGLVEFSLEHLPSALGIEWSGKDEFVIFNGHFPPPIVSSRFRLDYYSIFCPNSGEMQIELDLKKYKVRKNDLIMVGPSEIVQIDYITPETEGIVVAFKKSFLDGEYLNPMEKIGFLSSGQSIISLEEEEYRLLRRMMTWMIQHLGNGNRINRMQIAAHMICILLNEIDAILTLKTGNSEKHQTTKDMINNQFRRLVSIYYLQERSVRFYANLLHTSPRHLNELSKEITGLTASEYIDEVVIKMAKVLLKNTTHSVKQIAEELKFSDQFSFSKYFKKNTRYSPSDYRTGFQ